MAVRTSRRFFAAERRQLSVRVIHTGSYATDGQRYIRRKRLDGSRRAEEKGGRTSRQGMEQGDIRRHGVVENRYDIDSGNADMGAATEAVFRRAAHVVGVIVGSSLRQGRHRQGLVVTMSAERSLRVRDYFGRKAEQFRPTRPSQEQLVRGECKETQRNDSPHTRRATSIPTCVSLHQRQRLPRAGAKLQNAVMPVPD